ncbi:hypothetical protein SAY86_015359 [Trapa natans]|uniref:NADH-ubiquinone reductase complex 1 MLRQ subunit n=1 Tax=Trapa natans TaxID=22666 RepID=A0AAN7KM07_TRANT|nr:hypothetical protein SAY86_015359 [Trapa natans]
MIHTHTVLPYFPTLSFKPAFLVHCSSNMARWVRPEVYPLMAAMAFVSSMCVFQLTRNVFLNPDVRINKASRSTAVLDNADEGEKYRQHGLRKFLSTHPPEIMPSINQFFSEDK